ncbi:AraC family transcriptional regulator [Povalibacter sp.]|uniref:AraC family transcriptional regulator n=1 Tax=Povalibacter sp. TaxID=1962978 RepID=UPI002F4182A0
MYDSIPVFHPEHRAPPVLRVGYEGSSKSHTRRSNAGSRTLRRAVAFIEANLGERFSLELLANHAGVSRFHLARQFRQATGFSPMEYLMRQRIERGKRILARGDVSICEVAVALGFCDQSHFTRRFRRMTGQTPREYVRRCINN